MGMGTEVQGKLSTKPAHRFFWGFFFHMKIFVSPFREDLPVAEQMTQTTEQNLVQVGVNSAGHPS